MGEWVLIYASLLRATARHGAVPCKLNNVKMTFITLDKYKVCLRFEKQPTKILE